MVLVLLEIGSRKEVEWQDVVRCGGVEDIDVCSIVEYKATVDYLYMYDITDYEVGKIKSGS